MSKWLISLVVLCLVACQEYSIPHSDLACAEFRTLTIEEENRILDHLHPMSWDELEPIWLIMIGQAEKDGVWMRDLSSIEISTTDKPCDNDGVVGCNSHGYIELYPDVSPMDMLLNACHEYGHSVVEYHGEYNSIAWELSCLTWITRISPKLGDEATKRLRHYYDDYMVEWKSNEIYQLGMLGALQSLTSLPIPEALEATRTADFGILTVDRSEPVSQVYSDLWDEFLAKSEPVAGI